jgi:hypothetical protein
MSERPPDDPRQWHGHRIVTERDLYEAFPESDDVEQPHAYMSRLRHGVVLAVLAVLLAAAVLVAFGIARGDIRIAALEPSPQPTQGCPAGPFKYQKPATVRVNVYNASTVGGLAGATAEKLRKRSFNVAEVGNRTVNRRGMTAIIVSGPAGRAGAFTLQRLIPSTEYVEDGRTDASVDVVLGSGFEALVPPKKVDRKPGPLSCPRMSPSPSSEPAAGKG